jgi:hypothetical protein
MKRYNGYFGLPDIWLAVVDNAHPGDEYKFVVQGGVASGEPGPTLFSNDGKFVGFVLPGSSGFIYKWENTPVYT